MSRASSRDVRVGLAVIATVVVGLILLVMASGGPGYFTTSRTEVDVIFRDAQGLRMGQSVRVAGLDAGRVSAVNLYEYQGQLRARVRLSVPSELGSRLRQDAVITIQASLTGQNCVNISSLGESGVAWVPGQPIEGVESSLFDPLLEQVGLGPVERGHLSHTIGEIRGLVDDTVPRVRKVLASLQQVSSDMQMASEATAPALIAAAKELQEAAPRLESTLERVESMAMLADEMMRANRPVLEETIVNVRDLTGRSKSILEEHSPRLGPMLDGIELTRKRLDRALYNADLVASNAASLLVRNSPDVERTIANVRDATDFARMTTQKIYANPLLISPLYKPTRDDAVAQANFDTAQEFLQAAREFTDAMKRLQAMRQDPAMVAQQPAIDEMLRRAHEINARLDPISRRLAEGVQSEAPRGPLRNIAPRN